MDGNGVGIVYLEPGIHYNFDENTRQIESVVSPGENWVSQLKQQTHITADQVSSGFQVESLNWRQIRFKFVPVD